MREREQCSAKQLDCLRANIENVGVRSHKIWVTQTQSLSSPFSAKIRRDKTGLPMPKPPTEHRPRSNARSPTHHGPPPPLPPPHPLLRPRTPHLHGQPFGHPPLAHALSHHHHLHLLQLLHASATHPLRHPPSRPPQTPRGKRAGQGFQDEEKKERHQGYRCGGGFRGQCVPDGTRSGQRGPCCVCEGQGDEGSAWGW